MNFPLHIYDTDTFGFVLFSTVPPYCEWQYCRNISVHILWYITVRERELDMRLGHWVQETGFLEIR